MCNEAHSFEMLHISVKCLRSSNYMYIWKRLLLRFLELLRGECVRFHVIQMCVFTFGCACACVHHNDEQIKTVHHLSFIQNLTHNSFRLLYQLAIASRCNPNQNSQLNIIILFFESFIVGCIVCHSAYGNTPVSIVLFFESLKFGGFFHGEIIFVLVGIFSI